MSSSLAICPACLDMYRPNYFRLKSPVCLDMHRPNCFRIKRCVLACICQRMGWQMKSWWMCSLMSVDATYASHFAGNCSVRVHSPPPVGSSLVNVNFPSRAAWCPLELSSTESSVVASIPPVRMGCLSQTLQLSNTTYLVFTLGK